MKEKIKAIWNVLRGKPVMYRMDVQFSDRMTINNPDGALITGCTFRRDKSCPPSIVRAIRIHGREFVVS